MECGNDIIKESYRDLNGELTVDEIFSKCGTCSKDRRERNIYRK